MPEYIMYFGVVWINLTTLLAEISSETLVFFVLALVSQTKKLILVLPFQLLS